MKKIEDHYRRHWPGFRLFPEDGLGGSQHISFVERKAVPASDESLLAEGQPTAGLSMFLLQIPQEEGFEGIMTQPAAGDSLCYLMFTNFRRTN